MTSAVLAAQGVQMLFGGVAALDDVELSLSSGSWTGLIGPNGSGKTTLLNVLTGLYRPQRGEVVLGVDRITRHSPAKRAKAGMARTFQHPQLAPSLTIGENVALGRPSEGRKGGSGSEAVAAMELFGCAAYADGLPEEVPYGVRKIAEIARAVATRPRVLLLDEPAAGLSKEERQELVASLRAFREQHPAVAVGLIEHDIRLVESLCESMVVLNVGRVIARGDTASVLGDSQVREAYLGQARGVSLTGGRDD